MRTVLSLVALLAISGPAYAEFNGQPCQCRHQGGKVDEGTVMCIVTPQGPKLMLCETVLNNTSWREISNGCAVG